MYIEKITIEHALYWPAIALERARAKELLKAGLAPSMSSTTSNGAPGRLRKASSLLVEIIDQLLGVTSLECESTQQKTPTTAMA